MFEVRDKSVLRGTVAALLLLALTWVAPTLLYGGKKKKDETTAPAAAPLNIPNFREVVVFPPPPAITRLRYLDYFSAEKPPAEGPKEKPKKSWMDRMAGVSPDSVKGGALKKRFQLLAPYGVAVDSKGRLYVADTKVGAIFIFNTENNDVELMKHGVDARFGEIFGLAMDDNDRLFVSDGALHHVLVFNAKHKVEASIGDGDLKDPSGLALDLENRFLYVADTELDQVLVYDADNYKLLRKIGTTGKNHTLTEPGDFAKPTNLAVDKDGNLFVSDTWNDRIEVFDADGEFIRTFGKNGDGPGDFARPKGIAVDCDGHVWVADAMLNRIQVFTPEGVLLLAFGGFGVLPGQFQALTGMTIDKSNRVFTAEQLLGRVQMFRYVSNAEARAELERRQTDLDKKTQEKRSEAKPPADVKPPQANETAATAAASAAPERRGMKLPDAPVMPAQTSAAPK